MVIIYFENGYSKSNLLILSSFICLTIVLIILNAVVAFALHVSQ